MEEKEPLQDVSKKLDLIIGLLMQLRPSKRSEKEDILALKEAGLRIDEIARVLGKTKNSVYIIMSRSRRPKAAQ